MAAVTATTKRLYSTSCAESSRTPSSYIAGKAGHCRLRHQGETSPTRCRTSHNFRVGRQRLRRAPPARPPSDSPPQNSSRSPGFNEVYIELIILKGRAGVRMNGGSEGGGRVRLPTRGQAPAAVY